MANDLKHTPLQGKWESNYPNHKYILYTRPELLVMRLVRFWPDYFFCSFWLKLKIIIRGMCLWGPVNPNNKKKTIYNFALAE